MVKREAKRHPTLTSDMYAYCEVLISNTTFWKSLKRFKSLSKRLVDWIQIVWRSICLLLLSLYLSEPYSMTSIRDSSFKTLQLRRLSGKHHHGVFVFHLQKIGNARKSDWLFLFQHHNHTWDSRSLWNYDEICVH